MTERISPERIELFAAEYVKEFNATEAGRRIGYSGKHVSRRAYGLMERDDVKAAIKRALQRSTKKATMEGEEILRRMEKIVRLCMKKGKFQADPAIRALVYLGRHHGLFGDKREGEAFDPLIINLPGVNQTIMVTNGATNGRSLPATADERTVQDLSLLPSDVGKGVAGGVQAVPASSGDDERT